MWSSSKCAWSNSRAYVCDFQKKLDLADKVLIFASISHWRITHTWDFALILACWLTSLICIPSSNFVYFGILAVQLVSGWNLTWNVWDDWSSCISEYFFWDSCCYLHRMSPTSLLLSLFIQLWLLSVILRIFFSLLQYFSIPPFLIFSPYIPKNKHGESVNGSVIWRWFEVSSTLRSLGIQQSTESIYPTSSRFQSISQCSTDIARGREIMGQGDG